MNYMSYWENVHIPEKREWEYDAQGVRVYKGTRIPYDLEKKIKEEQEKKS